MKSIFFSGFLQTQDLIRGSRQNMYRKLFPLEVTEILEEISSNQQETF